MVNTKRSPEEILSFLEDKGNLGVVVTVDANSMSTAVQTSPVLKEPQMPQE